MSREEQVAKLEAILSHIQVPADGPFPEIDLQFVASMDRIAVHLYDHCGLRVVDQEG